MDIQHTARLFPIIATVLIEAASFGHVWRIVQERSSAGQSAVSYVLLICALVLWEAFYRLRTPEERIAVYTARLGIAVNVFVLGMVLWFR